MNTNLWRFRQSPIIVSFVGLALITDGRCANNPDKNVGTTASGTVVIVHNEAECHRDPIPKEFLPNSVQPVNIIVVNVNTTASFESDLRNQEDEFRIPIQQIGHRFTFFFKYPDTKSSTYKTYSVLSPSSTSLVKLPALVDKGLFVGQVCLAKTDDKQPTVPQRPSFRAPANWDGYATLAGLSRLTAPFQTFALYDLVSEEDDHGAGLVSGRIVEYLSTVPRKASELKPVSGLRVTVTGGMNGSNMTENLAGGVSDKNGHYRLELKAGEPRFDFYIITVAGRNYDPTVSLASSLGSQDDIVVLRAADEPVVASESLAPTVDGSELGGHFDAEDVQELPLGIPRRVNSLALLLPGVLPAAQTISPVGPRVGPDLGSAGEFSANGLRGTLNDFLVDGTDNNDENVGARRQGYLVPGPQSVESVSSFAVITALYDSRYGKAPGAQVDTSSLSGGAQMHFTSYGLLSDSRFDAENYFNGLVTKGSEPLTVAGRPVLVDGNPVTSDPIRPTRLPDTEVTAGAELSGAIPGLQNTYFVSSLELNQVRQDQRLDFAVPTISERGFMGTGATGLPITDHRFFSNSDTYPATLVGDAFFSLYPFPNNPAGPYGPNTYTRDRPANGDGWQASQRIDKTLRLWGTSFLGLRYGYQNSDNQIPETGGALDSGLNVQSQIQSFTGFLGSTPRSYLANTLRFSWGKSRFRYIPVLDGSLIPSNQLPGNSSLLNAPILVDTTTEASGPVTFQRHGFGDTESVIGAIGQLNIAGFSSVGSDPFNFPQRRVDNTFQVADSISVTRGRQTFTAGAEAWFILLNSSVNQNARPSVSFYGEPLATDNSSPPSHFGALLSPASLAAIGLEGNVRQTLTTTPNTSFQLYRPQLDLFFQDDVRVLRSLTLSLGFRFNANGAPMNGAFESTYGKNGTLLGELSVALSMCSAIHGQSFCANAYDGLEEAFPPGFAQVYRAAPFGYNPRFGLAWDPVGHGGTVIRFGVGAYSGQLPAEIISESGELFPRSLPLLYASGALSHFRNLGSTGSPVPIVPGTLNALPQGTNVVSLLNTFLSPSSNTPAGSIISEAFIVPVEPSAGLKNPAVQEFGLAFDQSLAENIEFSMAYVGTLADHLVQANEPYARIPQTLDLDSGNYGMFCPNPPPGQLPGLCPGFNYSQAGHINLADPTVYSSTARSVYNSLQLRLRARRAWLEASSALTWSHSIDDASDMSTPPDRLPCLRIQATLPPSEHPPTLTRV